MKINIPVAEAIFWTVFVFVVMFAIADMTHATLTARMEYLLLSAVFYMASIIAWIIAWEVVVGRDGVLLKVGFKSLAGIFAPVGLGSDLLKVYFGKKCGFSGSRLLSASFVVKYFKFLMMFAFLITAVFMLGARMNVGTDLKISFIAAAIMMIFGACIVLSMRIPSVARWVHRRLNKVFVMRFHRNLNEHFLELRVRKAILIIGLLLVSTFFEMAAAWACFKAAFLDILPIHVFIFGATAHTLSLIAITPSGVGFVESGSYLLLTHGFFSLASRLVGDFLILWTVVRLWIPTIVGLISMVVWRS